MVNTRSLPLLFLLGANACDVFQIHTALYVHFDDKSDETGWSLSCDDGNRYWSVPQGSLAEPAGSWASYTACIDDTAQCFFQITGDDEASEESRPGSHFNLRYGDSTIQEGSLPRGLITVCIGLGCDAASYPTKAPRAATPTITPASMTFGPQTEQIPTKAPSNAKNDATGVPSNAPTAAPVVTGIPTTSAPFSMEQLLPSAVSFTRSPVLSPVVETPVSMKPVSETPTPELVDNDMEPSTNDNGTVVGNLTTRPAVESSPPMVPATSSPVSMMTPTAAPVTQTITRPVSMVSDTAAPIAGTPAAPSSSPPNGTVSASTDAKGDGLDETSKFWSRRLTYIIIGILALSILCLVLMRCLCCRPRRRKALQQRDRLDFQDAPGPDLEQQRTWSPRNSSHVYS